MNSLLKDKNILVGVTGSIAAYKTAEIVRGLRRDGAHVTVVMTRAGEKFVTPLTFAALSGNRVHVDMFDTESPEHIPHISLAKKSDLILVAPATARTIARMAYGSAEDLLSAIILASRTMIVVCPAMNSSMFLHQATQDNLKRIKKFGYIVVNPDKGELACDEEGPGRLPDWNVIRETVLAAFSKQDLKDRSVLISAGPTREPLDPVRFLSNYSTGKMGYALATTARRRGASVTLVSGPTSIPAPLWVKLIKVDTAEEMYKAILNFHEHFSIIVKAAAVSDFRPAGMSAHKLKKATSEMKFALKENRDILKELGRRKKKKGAGAPFLAGFAAESKDLKKEGKRKLEEKNLDIIAINDITRKDSGFGSDNSLLTLLDRRGKLEELPLMSKEETANLIWDRIVGLL
ncbi:MAG: bifunctional phosphopantothenoylcysteine decarboxylase/phosphopantothenate--cysteine ligase CoaBC [Thermodesulfobacteriota bacterium]|nr:bifunctional phosphopantothenoylcysteine decarboxylase/phosphopantothenate--cysteine ligase CoaBC [Thermodesulfobacteriota bacterium]